MGNLQLVSQYLTILGSLALALHDTVQAREILRSSLTLAKKLSDIPTQIWVLSVLTGIVVPVAFNFCFDLKFCWFQSLAMWICGIFLFSWCSTHQKASHSHPCFMVYTTILGQGMGNNNWLLNPIKKKDNLNYYYYSESEDQFILYQENAV